MSTRASGGQTDWKDKYLSSLDLQEKRDRQQQQLTSLLMRALVRISLVAEGVDEKLDQQLAGLRKMLRDGSPSSRDLNTLVDALEGQVKRLDMVKDERAKVIAGAFKSLLDQLQRLKPGDKAGKKLKKLNRSLKTRSSRIQEYSSLINEMAGLTQLVLQDSGELRISKPFWHRWSNIEDRAEGNTEERAEERAENSVKSGTENKVEASTKVRVESDTTADEGSQLEAQDVAKPDMSTDTPATIPILADTDGAAKAPQHLVKELENALPGQEADVITPPSAERIDEQSRVLELADADPADSTAIDNTGSDNTRSDNAASDIEEPPFSRLNKAICEVLTELLDQIEPPPLAKDNYQAAQKLIAKGLNWYELVATLEHISLVVITAFDSHQKDFEHFLTQLNDRLSAAYEYINTSKDIHDEGVAAGRQLNDSMREQVSAMAQSVSDATELEQLKTAVNGRLEDILSAMDNHQNAEVQRDDSLSGQLDSLVERVKNMEQASEQAEERIEEQRQRALRDVLTQLPNREAYELRLELEFDRWRRYGHALTMVVCDIDHFKRINDGYGHLAGDKVLRIIAKSLRQRLRKTDFIARFGGEEFVILMPETEQGPALTVIEGLREAIASCPFHFKEQPVSITLSFGISGFREGDQAEGVFARCDKALYQAKDQGRNRCIVAVEPTQAVEL